MNTTCNKTQLSKSGALYVLGQLIIWVEGRKPTRCHKARVERWPYRIYPAQYQVVACIDEGVICPQMEMPYTTAASFTISQETLDAMGGLVVLHHRDGAEKVPVKVIKLSAEQTKSAAAEDTGGGGMPFPFSLGKVIETGRGEDIQILSGDKVKLHTATGYSNSFSFTEALQDAIGNLPPDTDPYPDKLVNVRVVQTGAEFGGIAGLNRMYVTVASFY
ncbi:MAG TPA: hypothetical protein VEM96_02415 [Pyrinomonadaceae bacterium]|nr:hypothetical protein [Pyrinomonadaceae bacterium]